jgi:AmmeMemoRadiSam system protein A
MNANVEGGVVIAALMPHAPILIPAIARDELSAVAASVASLRSVARRIVESKPDVVVVVSPHSPRKPGAFGIWSGAQVAGDFGRFRAPDIRVEFKNDEAFGRELSGRLRGAGVRDWRIPQGPLDHGASVPLWYLAEAGWTGPVSVLSLNYPGEGGLAEVGQALRNTARGLGIRVAVIASGDMSHRLKPDSAAGYEPRAREFDQAFITCLKRGAYTEVDAIDSSLRDLAAEDVVDSAQVAFAAVESHAEGGKVFSYEGPFGVGYGVAVLFDGRRPAASGLKVEPGEDKYSAFREKLPAVAREALRAALFNEEERAHGSAEGVLREKRAVFVTLRTHGGKLRGCIGTLTPKYANVLEETRQMSCAAAFDDGRFEPVRREEFSTLSFEVSVLQPLEEVKSEHELDPARYGVVVRTEDGRRGCLLPGIDEIRTVREQLDVARRKGRIDASEPVRLQRFEVVKCLDAPSRERI